MTSRWDVERALLVSDLPSPARLLLLVLLVHANAQTADTGKYSPSLTKLGEETGLDRSTVRRHLDRLEREGWVIRHRPPVALARSQKARTRYVLRDPARGTVPPENAGLGAESPQPRGTVPPELGAENTTSRGTVPPRTDLDQRQTSSQVTERIVAVLEEIGGRPVDPAHAERVARQIGPGKSNTLAYVERCIRNDPDRFLPTAQPPRFTAASGFQGDRP